MLLGFTSYISSVIVGIQLYPGEFDWRKRVMSRAISPHHNPDAYWIPSLGIAVCALLLLPFAGYVQGRLKAITPRGSRFTGFAFASGILLLLGVALPLPAQLPLGFDRLHEVLARSSAAGMTIGVLCCCGFAFKDRQLSQAHGRVLRKRLAYCWMSLPLMLLGFGLICGALMLGRAAKLEWALYARQVLRPTMFWQLAFWEWVGILTFFAFIWISALWLPEHIRTPVPELVLPPDVPVAGRAVNGPEFAVLAKRANSHAQLEPTDLNAATLISPRTVSRRIE